MDSEDTLMTDTIKSEDSADTIRVRCIASTKKNTRCKSMVEFHPSKRLEAYCYAHLDRIDEAKVKRCDGVSQKGQACSHRVRLTSISPVFCNYHRHQASVNCLCFGSTSPGVRCTTIIPWKDPFFQFCVIHADQATTFKCSISELPNDILDIIVEKLRPTERVALALSNHSCHDVVKASCIKKQNAMSRPHPKLLHVPLHSDLAYVLGQTTFMLHHGHYPEADGCNCHDLRVNPLDFTSHTLGNLTVVRWRELVFRLRSCIMITEQLREVLRTCTWLFSSAPPGRCVSCKHLLSAADSSSWAEYELRMYRSGQSRILPSANKEIITPLCRACIDMKPKFFMQWCKRCFGELSQLTIARAYTSTQQLNPQA